MNNKMFLCNLLLFGLGGGAGGHVRVEKPRGCGTVRLSHGVAPGIDHLHSLPLASHPTHAYSLPTLLLTLLLSLPLAFTLPLPSPLTPSPKELAGPENIGAHAFTSDPDCLLGWTLSEPRPSRAYGPEFRWDNGRCRGE